MVLLLWSHCLKTVLGEIISTSGAAVIRPKLLRNDGSLTSVVIPLLGHKFPALINKQLTLFAPKETEEEDEKLL